MGKWSFTSVKFSDEYRDKSAVVEKMTKEEVQAEWERLGSPELGEYGLNLWSGISGDGWATIDNSAAKSYDYKSHPLQLFCDRQEFLQHYYGKPEPFKHWFQRACILADRVGVPRSKPEVSHA